MLDECLPFNELKVLSSFVANIKKEFPVEIEVVLCSFSLSKSITHLPERTSPGRKHLQE